MDVHMIHISGKNMIAQGTGGLSRGVMSSSSLECSSFLDFVPLHKSALDRQEPDLFNWILSWFLGDVTPLFLEPKDWFLQGQIFKACVWSPPPAATDVALEQLAYSIHKRPYHTHVIVIPRLLTARWRKLLGKICCITFTVPLGCDVWHDSQFEPLLIGLYLPLSRHRPWNLRGTPVLERVKRLLREMPASTPRWGRIVLRELFQQTRSLDSMPASVVRYLLHPSG